MTHFAILGLLLFSQYFGQNKIQYRDFDYQIITSEHFDIYFYPGGEELATFAEQILEDGYEMLSAELGIEAEFRIPVILYNSPNDFSQTNVTLQLIEEAVGGFTEILKNRMVIPFTGDYEDFRHVLVHELTHVFQFVIFFPSRLEAIFSGDIFYSIPLWAMEGQSEFMSLEWDLETDIIMRDLIMNNKVIPLGALENYGGYVIYKEGQAFYRYVADKYGRQKCSEFIHLLKAKKDLEATFLALFGVTVDEFNKRWIRYYQLQYWPKISLQENFEQFARIVFDHNETRSIYNTSTAISPSGDKIAFISDQSGVAELIIISSIDGQVLKRLVKSEYSAGYEGLHLYQGGLAWSPDGRYIAFAAKSKGEDVLYLTDTDNGRVHKRLRLDLDGVYSPKYSADGKKIVFTSLNDGYSDIYVLDIESETIEKVTDDIYTDNYPCFSPDGLIAFVSDRPDSSEEYPYGNYALFVYNNGSISRITPRTTYVATPAFHPDGGIFFVADYDSSYNLYFYALTQDQIIKKTNILTGVYYPSVSEDGSKIAFAYYDDYGYDVCVVKEPLTKMEDCQNPAETPAKFAYEAVDLASERIKKYRTKFTFDYFIASATYYSTLGFSGVGVIALSDVLGNHLIQFGSNFYGNITDSDIFLNYWYLKKRPDYGISLFQYLNYFSENYDLLIWRYVGLGGTVQYPIDRFLRIELGAYAYRVYETRWLNFFPFYYSDQSQTTSYDFLYPQLAFVYDNVRWGPIGPHQGRRFRIEGYATLFSDYDIISTIVDYRRYFRLSPRASFATRLVLAGSFGADEELWSIGGTYSLRGYRYYAFSGSRIGFLNLEYRFPFIDRLKIAFPIPMEITNIRGVLFADMAGVHSDSFQIYENEPYFHLQDLKLGIGGGLRFNLFYVIFKLDWARAYNFHDFPDDWKFYLTLGPEW